MPTRTVSGLCNHVDGTPWVGGTVSFMLEVPFETATEVYPRETHSEILSASGEFSITLGVPDLPATAQYRITTPDAQAYRVFIASGAPVSLQTLLTLDGTAVLPNDLQTLLDQYSVLNITNVNAAYDVLDTDDLIRATGTFTVTLPAATGSGAVYIVKNVGVGVITLAAQAGETIDGAASVAIAALDCKSVVDAASGAWDVIGGTA